MNRIALVTGGTGGIGTAICKSLSKQGITVVANYRNEDKARKWFDQIKSLGFENIHLAKGDVAIYESIEIMVEQIRTKYGTIDILVNNAGITRDIPFKKMSYEAWDDVIKCNLYGMFNCTKLVVEDMIEKNYGRIVNVSSINGQRGQFGQVNYSASKAAIHGFTKSLAMELIAKGITVNTISPGYIATDMIMKIPSKYRDNLLKEIPIGRFGKGEEVANAITYLISEHSDFITGSNLSINGGQHTY